eukprot:7602577-Alexandrium_andersonii.AAC.1
MHSGFDALTCWPSYRFTRTPFPQPAPHTRSFWPNCLWPFVGAIVCVVVWLTKCPGRVSRARRCPGQ